MSDIPTSTPSQVPFSKLVASDAINARGATKEGLDELVASIAARGLIQPLCVRPALGEKYDVIDGRRRHAALSKLVKAKSITKDFLVPVLVRNDDDASALETSLVANTVRLPMHPVDQHAVFARLVEQGAAEDDVAARFGISLRTVRQQLALSKLAPAVRDAWKKGAIDSKLAQLFTLHADHGVQTATFQKLKKEGTYGLTEHRVRAALSGDTREPLQSCQEVEFVGVEAYLAAGGKLVDDLFDDQRYVADLPLAKKLARDKLQAECDRLVADGWAWALPSLGDRGDPQPWMFDDLPDDDGRTFDPTKYTAEERARAGVLVEMTSSENTPFDYQAGLVKRGDANANADDSDEDDTFEDDDFDEDEDGSPGEDTDVSLQDDDSETDDEVSPFAPTAALLETITGAQTEAVRLLVKEDFELSLRLVLAALLSEGWSTPAKIEIVGAGVNKLHKTEQRAFGRVWPEVAALSYGEAMKRFAEVVAGATSLVEFSNQPFRVENRTALIASLPSDKYLRWTREAFNAADYFKRSTKTAALACADELRDAGCVTPPEELPSWKKANAAEWAAEHAKAHGWLPPGLRNAAYALVAAPSPSSAPSGRLDEGESEGANKGSSQ